MYEKLSPELAEKIINDTRKMGYSTGGIKNPAWVVDHDFIEGYIISITADSEEDEE